MKKVRKSPSKYEEINKLRIDLDERAMVSWDGKQLLVRIPRKIAEAMDVKKGDSLRFRTQGEKPELIITYEAK